MWPFRRKKKAEESSKTGVPCPFCGSTGTKLILNHGTDRPGYVKIWRGQRSLTYRCSACGRDFYAAELPGGISDEAADDNRLIDDEEALRAAEEELKKQIDEEDDRRCP